LPHPPRSPHLGDQRPQRSRHPVWRRRPTRTNKGKIPLFIVGVDAVRNAVYARLKLTEPGPSAIHFLRRLDADYFR